MLSSQLLTFISVAKYGSFSRAAEEGFVSPAAVKKQIDALENRLGITLFYRTNHGLRLTASGKSLLEDAKYLVDYVERAEEKAREADKKENGKSVRIGTSVMTPAKFILDIWEEVKRYAPDLKFELIPFENTPENAREILKNLGTQIDAVAGIYDEKFKKERGFKTARMKDKKISFAVPLSSPIAEKKVVSPEDLRKTGAMFIKKGWNRYIDEMRGYYEAVGVAITDFDFFNLAAYNEAVKRNIPVIAIDDRESVHPLLKIIPAERGAAVPYGIMYSPNPSDNVKKFIKAVEKIVGAKK